MNNKKEIDRQINQIMVAGPQGQPSDNFYPGGYGGGGKRKGTGRPVVLPHPRTYEGCHTCGRMHSTEDHEDHERRRDPSYVPKRRTSKAKNKTTTTKPIKAQRERAKKVIQPKTEKASKKRTRAKRAERSKVEKTTKPKAPAPRATSPNPSLLDAVREAIPRVGPKGRYGKDNVFVYALWKKIAADPRLPAMSLDSFKHWLVNANRNQLLILARADMVDDMEARLVEASEIEDLGATFHFVIDRSIRNPYGRHG